MSITRGLTEYAQVALEEMFNLQQMCWFIMTDIDREERSFSERNKKWPAFEPVSNKRFNDVASRSLGILQLCRAVDLYNWYCRQVLTLAVKTNPRVVDLLRKAEQRIAKTISKAEKAGADPAAALVTNYLARSANDHAIREAIHEHLQVTLNPEVETICESRNIIVHHRGHDDGRVADALGKMGSQRAMIGAMDFPAGHMPIKLDANCHLCIEARIGAWAISLLQQQIHTMDQNFSYVYKLPTKRWRPRPFGRISSRRDSLQRGLPQPSAPTADQAQERT